MRIKRVGNVVTSYVSADGAAWTQVGSATIALGATPRVGLFVTSHDGSKLATATFTNVLVEADTTAPGGVLPSPWVSHDVGAPRLAGSASYNATGGIFTLNGAGDDIWDTADQFQFVHRPMVGNGVVTARVVSATPATDGWAKYGIMFKNSTTALAPYALAGATQANGFTFQHSFNFGVDTGAGAPTLPYWIRLTRVGNTFTAERSADGTTWIIIGTPQTIPAMAANTEAGLFVTSHNGSVLKTVTFDNVTFIDN